jgi:hypothetical protein
MVLMMCGAAGYWRVARGGGFLKPLLSSVPYMSTLDLF